MSSLIVKSSRDELESALEKFDVVPVHGVIDSPTLRPIDALLTLRKAGEPSFIFESESPEEGASRYSYVCPSIEAIVRTGASEIAGDINPLTTLRSQFKTRTVAPIEELPALITGAFGFVSYEAIKHFEPSVGDLPADPTGSPLSAMAIPSELLVFDHALNQLHIIVFANNVERFDLAEQRIEQICNSLQTVLKRTLSNTINSEAIDLSAVASNSSYPSMVSKAREAIIEGELIQVVLGQRVEKQTTANPINIYEQLSTMNPSPYMYMLDLGDFQLIGASPELMLRSTNGKAAVHPIAGTRPRGTTAEEDLQYEADLLSNEKESAEHVMLVDLARNDLGRVSNPGTVNVKSLKHIERYSHVMHLVSRVEGELADKLDGIDAFEAGFPIGTLSGAPKIRSIQLIAELESEGRGPYCGGIGWFAQNGDVDTGTIIRSIVLRNGTAHVQGGAGIVFDSDPQAENLESLQKAKAPLLAIARAEAISRSTQTQHWRSDHQSSISKSQPATMQLASD
ncbi:anthranilate synthase component I family protein [Candidatus Lucifugimonas marina]|uniref:Anthranilate synthase component I n=1 Tax=Candidatus Lucifugimonas marina TaxID=3038979 RepID=A0AAJ5ZGH3_9CHLR|nr:anthranilate synthase component I [SAR202 cluster bacterium JH702]MDG0870633.1 anthranilate synthase component I [SAR202 cluster bacterium JH639]WFG36577.1 anthranilate synthase component I [SAR202 cluster bacterium JH545]WFG40510.1 anthranilate synthase component I [SAR202 cluster bacterium JH1073]